MANLLDIYFLKVKFRLCEDPRPCIVIDIGNGKIALISSATGLARPGYDFLIRADHPDLPQQDWIENRSSRAIKSWNLIYPS